jgi:predicted phosphodiesterase
MMPKIKSKKRLLVEEYCRKFPKTAHLQLAKLIYKENIELYKNAEEVRSFIRLVRGKRGDTKRKQTTDKSLYENFKRSSASTPKNPYLLPESYEINREPFVLPKANKNILVISDLHIPYHSIDAITLALNYGKEHKVDTIIINGDLLDFYMLSRFHKDPRRRKVNEELTAARQFLQILRHNFKGANIYYLLGNHDVRYQIWLESKAVELLGCEEFELGSLLRLGELGIQLINDKTLIKAGKLIITHGHLVIRGVFAPVNAARGAYLRAKQSVLIGHTHKISEHTETNMDREITTTWSTGCLCELSPDYNPFANGYAHGFAHVTITDDEGRFSVKNLRIYNGTIL